MCLPSIPWRTILERLYLATLCGGFLFICYQILR